MIFELPNEPYQFSNPNDPQWLPTPYALFREDCEYEIAPSPKTIEKLCQQINSKWDEKEKSLRRLRAMAACEYGVCRNF